MKPPIWITVPVRIKNEGASISRTQGQATRLAQAKAREFGYRLVTTRGYSDCVRNDYGLFYTFNYILS